MDWIGRSWSGEEECWKVVWIYGVFYIFIAKILAIGSRLLLDTDLATVYYHGPFLTTLRSVYTLWLFVSLWRCACNTDWIFWGYLIRPLLVLFFLAFFGVCYLENKIIEPWELTDYGGFMHDHGGTLLLIQKLAMACWKRLKAKS